jgi:replicative DNA helicase
MIQVATDAITRSYDTKLETRDLLDKIESSIFSITEKKYTSNYEPLSLVLERTRKDIENWYRTKEIVTGIGSGFRDLDELLTGFHPSELIIIASRPGMGKTALALNIINHVALKEKKAALFFSLEMPAEQLGMRLICVEAMVDSQLLRTGRISQDDYRSIDMAITRLGQAPLYIDDTPSVNILEIRAKARRLAAREPVGLIVVDYLQLVSAIERRVDRHLQIGEISRFLKQLARELSVPVIALSQLSRAVEQRTDQRPTLADLRESGSIEQDADVVVFLYREEKVKRESEKKGIAELMVAKQRSGPVGNIELFFWEKFTKFGNLEKTHSYEEAIPTHELE